jgi:hypothetical protein
MAKEDIEGIVRAVIRQKEQSFASKLLNGIVKTVCSLTILAAQSDRAASRRDTSNSRAIRKAEVEVAERVQSGRGYGQTDNSGEPRGIKREQSTDSQLIIVIPDEEPTEAQAKGNRVQVASALADATRTPASRLPAIPDPNHQPRQNVQPSQNKKRRTHEPKSRTDPGIMIWLPNDSDDAGH